MSSQTYIVFKHGAALTGTIDTFGSIQTYSVPLEPGTRIILDGDIWCAEDGEPFPIPVTMTGEECLAPLFAINCTTQGGVNA